MLIRTIRYRQATSLIGHCYCFYSESRTLVHNTFTSPGDSSSATSWFPQPVHVPFPGPPRPLALAHMSLRARVLTTAYIYTSNKKHLKCNKM